MSFAGGFIWWWQGAGGAPPVPPAVTPPTGGWERLPREFGRVQTDAERRAERERLGILPRQQKDIDKTARRIARTLEPGKSIAEQVQESRYYHLLVRRLADSHQNVVDMTVAAQALQVRLALMDAVIRARQAEADEAAAILAIVMEM